MKVDEFLKHCEEAHGLPRTITDLEIAYLIQLVKIYRNSCNKNSAGCTMCGGTGKCEEYDNKSNGFKIINCECNAEAQAEEVLK